MHTQACNVDLHVTRLGGKVILMVVKTTLPSTAIAIYGLYLSARAEVDIASVLDAQSFTTGALYIMCQWLVIFGCLPFLG